MRARTVFGLGLGLALAIPAIGCNGEAPPRETVEQSSEAVCALDGTSDGAKTSSVDADTLACLFPGANGETLKAAVALEGCDADYLDAMAAHVENEKSPAPAPSPACVDGDVESFGQCNDATIGACAGNAYRNCRNRGGWISLCLAGAVGVCTIACCGRDPRFCASQE